MGIKVSKVISVTLECIICWDSTTYKFSWDSPNSYEVSDPDNFTSYGSSPRMLAEKNVTPPIFCDRCRAMAFIARWKDAEFTAEGNFTEYEVKVVDVQYITEGYFSRTKMTLEKKKYEYGKLVKEDTFQLTPSLFYKTYINPKAPSLLWEEVRAKEDRPAN